MIARSFTVLLAFDSHYPADFALSVNPTRCESIRPYIERAGRFRPSAPGAPDIKLYVCATNVRTGKIRFSAARDLGPDALLASACLPSLFRAVEIEARLLGRRLHGQSGDVSADLRMSSRSDIILIVSIHPR